MKAGVSDEEIFKLIITEHNQEAYHILFERYWKKLYIKAFARLQNEEEAKDCVQNVFLTIWTKRDSLELPESVIAYLSASIRNSVFNHIKSQAARHAREEEFSQNSRTDTSHSLEFKELENIIETEVQRMPDKMRQIFILSRENSLTGNEIAEKLDLSQQTVRNQISMAIKRLRLTVERYGFS